MAAAGRESENFQIEGADSGRDGLAGSAGGRKLTHRERLGFDRFHRHRTVDETADRVRARIEIAWRTRAFSRSQLYPWPGQAIGHSRIEWERQDYTASGSDRRSGAGRG